MTDTDTDTGAADAAALQDDQTAETDVPGDSGLGGPDRLDPSDGAAAAGDDESDDDAESADDGDDEESGEESDDEDGPSRVERLEAEGDIAADYLEELLDIADLDGDIDLDVERDRAAVSIEGSDVEVLVGTDGAVLDALQELTRLAVYRETGERSRLMLDIAGHRAEVRVRLVEIAQEAVDDVRESGEPAKLSPMTPFERKVVHDAVAAQGLRSESQGTEPTRCVVVLPG
jgi:spoIIIJ-associated protein